MDQTRETRTLPRVARVIVLTILMGMFLEMIPALLSAGVCTSRFIPKTPLIIWFAVVVYASVRILAFLEVGIGRFLMALFTIGFLSAALFWLSPGRYVKLDTPYYGIETIIEDVGPEGAGVIGGRYLYTADGLVTNYQRFARELDDLSSIDAKPFMFWQAGVAAGYLPDDVYDMETRNWVSHPFQLSFLLSVGPLAIADALMKSILYHMVPLAIAQSVIFMVWKRSLWWDKEEAPE